jgi:hypothetical protein
MPRPAKPYPCRGWYVTNLGGTRHRLCPLEDGPRAAAESLSKLRQEFRSNGGRPFPTLTVAELGALFLESVQVERTVHTYLDYRRWLLEFARRHGHRQVRDITRQDAQHFRNEIANGTWVRNTQSAKPYGGFGLTTTRNGSCNPIRWRIPISNLRTPPTNGSIAVLLS